MNPEKHQQPRPEHEDQYMAEVLKDVSTESLKAWLSSENLSKKRARSFQGFEIVDSIDGGINPEREVSLVKITEQGVYPQHIHKESDAFFVIVEGEATFLSGKKRQETKAGDTIEIPRNMPHGFELPEDSALAFVSIQSPPIRNPETGEEDFHLTDLV